MATFENSLLPSSLCGAEYDRCDILITSNADKSIQVVLLPLESGIGMVSFNYFMHNDSLSFRERFLLQQNMPDCTFVFFIEELIGYCLEPDPAKIRAFRIRINFTNLNASMIHRREDTSEVADLVNIANLSNFVYFIRHKFDGCFPNEGNHVIFLDQGDLFDHSFTDGLFLFPHVHIDSTCSKLHRVGDSCELAAHCDGKVVLFDTRWPMERMSFTEAEYGQTFFCPNGDFIRFEHEHLSLHHRNRQQFGSRILFPFEEIRRGRCLRVDDKFFFIATTDNGNRTVLVNFSDTSYQNLGNSDPSTIVPTKVKGRTIIVNNGSETHFYNLDLPCLPEPLVLPKNFVFATSALFSTGALDRYQCHPATTMSLSPIERAVPIISPTPSTSSAEFMSGSPSLSSLPTTVEPRLLEMASTVSILLPMSTNIPRSSLLSEGGMAGVVIAVLVTLTLITLLVVAYCFHLWW